MPLNKDAQGGEATNQNSVCPTGFLTKVKHAALLQGSKLGSLKVATIGRLVCYCGRFSGPAWLAHAQNPVWSRSHQMCNISLAVQRELEPLVGIAFDETMPACAEFVLRLDGTSSAPDAVWLVEQSSQIWKHHFPCSQAHCLLDQPSSRFFWPASCSAREQGRSRLKCQFANLAPEDCPAALPNAPMLPKGCPPEESGFL
jgi:hypothetical protein